MKVERKHLLESPFESVFLPVYDPDSDSFSAFCDAKCLEPPEYPISSFCDDPLDEAFDKWLHSMEDSI